MLSYHGRNRSALNYLKALYFDSPEWTPCRVSLMPATWMKYRTDLEALVLAYPRLFPGYERGSKDFDAIPSPLYEEGEHTDCWGIVWKNVERGLDSIPVVHPLAEWAALESYMPPDPDIHAQFGERDWAATAGALVEARERGNIASAGLPHGFVNRFLSACCSTICAASRTSCSTSPSRSHASTGSSPSSTTTTCGSANACSIWARR